MRQRATVVVMFLALLGAMGGTAHALLIEPIGDPIAGNSWLQRWDFSIGSGEYVSKLEFRWKAPSTESFELPVAQNVSHSDWSSYAESPVCGWIQGPTLTNNHIECDLIYTPRDCNTPSITHYITACHDSKPFHWWKFRHDGCGWHCCDDGNGDTPVPEPASCALLALAAGGIGAMLRRRRRR